MKYLDDRFFSGKNRARALVCNSNRAFATLYQRYDTRPSQPKLVMFLMFFSLIVGAI